MNNRFRLKNPPATCLPVRQGWGDCGVLCVFKTRGLASVALLMVMCLMAGACARHVQAVNYLDPRAPSVYTDNQRTQGKGSVKSIGDVSKMDYKSDEARGDQALARGLMEEALSAYQQALSLNPNPGSIHYKMGRIILNLGKPDQALAHFEKVLKTDPYYARDLEGLGLAYIRKGQHQEAEKVLKMALELDSGLAAVHNGLGILHDRQGNHERAIQSYQQALLLEPENGSCHNNLGYSLLLSGDLDGAIASLKKAVRLDPGNHRAHNNLGYAYGLKGNYDLAFEEFLLATDEAGAYNNLGYVYYMAGRSSEAAASFGKAIESRPTWYSRASENLEGIMGGMGEERQKE